MEVILACNDLEEAIKRYGKRVQCLAFAYLRNVHDAEDIAQDVFVTYLTQAPCFSSEQKEKSWLLKVTVNRCKSILRSSYRKEIQLSENLSYLPEEESAVLQAVLSLDKKYRLPIHLYYYEGYTVEEIAKLLHTPSGTIGSRLSRGRKILKNELGDDYFEG